MSDLLNDQNEFDKIVKSKNYRWDFLKNFESGWENGKHPGSYKVSDIDIKLKYLLSLIKKYDLASLEKDEKEMKLFALYLGWVVGIFRFPFEERSDDYGFFQLWCVSKTIVEILISLKDRGYWPYFLALRGIIIDWSDKEKHKINKLVDYRLKDVRVIFSALQ